MSALNGAEQKLLEAIKTNSLIWVMKFPAKGESPTTYYFHNKPFFSAEEENDQAAAALFPENLCIFQLPSESMVEGMRRFLLTDGYSNQLNNQVVYEEDLEIRRRLERSKAAAAAVDASASDRLKASLAERID